MLLFYKEKNGAYLVISTETNEYYPKDLGEDSFEGRSCITYHPDPAYVNTGTIARKYLKQCKRVAKKDVPKVWLKMLI